ncbi:MAG: phage protein Gp36 family protein [Planctomycetota bacterium]
MAYITNTDIDKRLGTATYLQLSDDNNDGVADAAVVDEARLGAEGEVDSYFARRFQTPIAVSQEPQLAALIKSIVLDLVEVRLRSRRPPVSTNALQQAERARDWLRRVASGAIELPLIGEVATQASRGPIADVVGSAKVLSRDELADF